MELLSDRELRDNLRAMRVVQAGWAFGVPEDGREQWLDEVVAAVGARPAWRDLYDWLGTEIAAMDRLTTARGGEAAAAVRMQANELRHVREHMRQADPSLPVVAGVDDA